MSNVELFKAVAAFAKSAAQAAFLAEVATWVVMELYSAAAIYEDATTDPYGIFVGVAGDGDVVTMRYLSDVFPGELGQGDMSNHEAARRAAWIDAAKRIVEASK